MAKLSSDGKSVTVEKGDTLWDIAKNHLGSGAKYKQLAAINNISNPDLISIGQVIKLTNEGSSSSSSVSSSSNKPTINQFGVQSNADNTLFATWTWGKSNTASYKVLWSYDTGDDVWFVGNNSTINVDTDSPESARQSTYSIPSGALKVRFKVKPISETYRKNDTETKYWEADWSDIKTFNVNNAYPKTPPVPSVEINKYKLTATLENLDVNATGIQFQIVKNNSATVFNTAKVEIVSTYASYSCTVDAGGEYKVRCRSYKSGEYSEWSDYSSNLSTIPSTPSDITTIRATSGTSIYLEWSAVESATSYDIEYATKKEYFDGSDQTTTISSVEFTHYEKTGLESGAEYFFRVRAVNDKGQSAWSGLKSIVIGKKPAPPTTWSSTTTVITGDTLNLYWVHNAEDGSSQKFAELELEIGDITETYMIENPTYEEEKNKTSVYTINTSDYVEGTQIQWKVRTAGITQEYSDWSILRTVDIYAPATLEINMTNASGERIETLTTFPFKIYGLAGPKTQKPIGYNVTIISNEIYETVDSVGNTKTINKGEQVYSKYFDIMFGELGELDVNFSASDIDLENNISYTVVCTASMNSGLTAESSLDFTVTWTDTQYEPNAEIGVNEDTLTAYIRPYCERRNLVNYKVEYRYGIYTVTSDLIGSVWGNSVKGAKTITGEQLYYGMTADGEELYYCAVEEKSTGEEVTLSVYRREFDGSFTELGRDLDGTKNFTITDPHPALDYARYRIVATSKATGAVSYYDPPGYPVGGTAVVIQWDEKWTRFETSEEAALEQPPWSGSLLKLPYNIDVSDNHKADVALIEYIGRTHPISYYGTQRGQTSTWNVEIEKSDEETLYMLRRLANWMGDVYVREPSGSGYWANVSVSFSQKHCELIIPVTLSITRVEGGI